MSAGRRGPFDIQIGTLLLPFAVPRTALRLTGDVLFEPISAALAAIGIGAALLRARRDSRCASGLGMLIAALLPSLAGSQYDRVSLTRAILLPVAVGLFAALTLHAFVKTWPARAYAAAAIALTAVIVVSGSLVFDVVNPRLLGTSAMELVLETRASMDAGSVAVLAGSDKRDVDWLHVERIARYAATRPLDVVPFAGARELSVPPARDADVLMWSPGLEEDAAVSRALCAAIPSATLFELRSRSGLSRAYAAARDTAWRPPSDSTRWAVRSCPLPRARR